MADELIIQSSDHARFKDMSYQRKLLDFVTDRDKGPGCVDGSIL